MWFILVDLYFGPVFATTIQMRCYRSLGTSECVHSYTSAEIKQGYVYTPVAIYLCKQKILASKICMCV